MASSSSTAPYDVTTAATTAGAGGKFRKKPLRRPHATPYDRPPTASRPYHGLSGNGNDIDNGWLAKIVTPASKLITFGASKIFSSVFRNRLLPPLPLSPPPLPPLQGDGDEVDDMEHETATKVVNSVAKLPVECGGNDRGGPSYSNGVAELEGILKQKTFTRSEIDQLTALMLSRTSENSDGAEKRNSEPKVSEVRAIPAHSDKLSNRFAHESHNEHVVRGGISTPEVRSKVLPDDVASPAEIAKAYMASRSTEMSPSVLCLQNQLPKEDSSTPYNPSAKLISPAIYLTQKAVGDVGISSNGFMTPRLRERSAMYKTTRTPYSRVYPVTTFKAAETNLSIGGGSSYHNVKENSQYKKQALKRSRSSVLENDIGSVGPIRRIRRKSNFLHPKTPTLPPPSGNQATHVSSVLSDVTDVRSSVECSSQNRSFSKVLAVNSSPGTSGRYVPSQSIKMAQKIFEQLDKFSPKGNLNKKPDVSAGTSPSKKPDMEDSLKRSLSRQDTEKFKGSLDSVHEHNHPTETSSMVKQDYPLTNVDVPSNVVAERRQHAESPRNSVVIPDILQRDQTISVERPLETNSAAQLRKSELENVANGCSGFETTVGFPSAILSSSSDMTAPDANSTLQSTQQSHIAPHLENSNIFTTLSSKSDNLSPFVGTLPSVAKDTKVEAPVSTNNTAAEAVPDKTFVKSTSLFGNAVIKSGDNPFVDALPKGSKTNNTMLNRVPSTLPATSVSNTADGSCQLSDAVGSSRATASDLDTKSSTLASGGNGIFSFPASTVKGACGDVQTDGPATTNKLIFPFQTGSTSASVSAPVSTYVPNFSGQSTSPSASVSGLSGPIGLSPVPVIGSDASSPFDSQPTTASSGLGNSFTSSSVFTSSSSTPCIFGFTSQSPKSTTLGLSGSAALTAGPIFGSGSANPFISKPTTAPNALASTSSSITSSIFGFTQSTEPSTTTAPAPPSLTFQFGPETTKAPTTSSFIFGATNNLSSASNSNAPLVFGGNSGLAASTPAMSISQFQSQPLFSNANSQPAPPVFASTPSTNADQMLEESMTEDSLQPAPPAFPAFGTPPSAPSGGFVFNAAPTTSSVFQFNTQQTPVVPQNPAFQSSGSLEFNGGTSSFSLGTSDKSQRRIIRVKKGPRKKL